MDKKKRLEKKDSKLSDDKDNSKNLFKSKKFFEGMEKVAAADKEKKDNKRKSKETGVYERTHNNQPSKYHKM